MAQRKSESMIEILRKSQPQIPPASAGGAQADNPVDSLTPSTLFATHPRGGVVPMQRGGRLMFENQQQDVEGLIKSDQEFRSLYQRHQELDSKVRDAELGVLPLDDTTLHNMKKEKLWAKDKLTSLWERHRSAH
jgi:uncharacterized protein YdcH (DUF465 family)